MSNGWGITNRPAPTITGHMAVTRSPSGTQGIYIDAIRSGDFIFRPCENPRDSRVAKDGIGSMFPPETINMDIQEGAVLQSYPQRFEVYGSKADQQLQIGNAVPPPGCPSGL